MMDNLLAALHGVDYLLTCLWIGLMIFLIWVAPAAPALFRAFKPRLESFLNGFPPLLLILSLIWLILVAQQMAESWSPQELLAVCTSTTFGRLWVGRIAVLTLLTAVAARTPSGRWYYWLALYLPLGFALSGHAGAQKRGASLFFSLAVDMLHQFSVSAWTGGLLGLNLWLRYRLREGQPVAEDTHSLVLRFSKLAVVSTLIIALSGLYMAWKAGVLLNAPFETSYSRVVFIKMCLFLSALAAASINHFVYLRNFNASEERRFSLALSQMICLEIALIVMIFVAAGILTRLMPPVG